LSELPLRTAIFQVTFGCFSEKEINFIFTNRGSEGLEKEK